MKVLIACEESQEVCKAFRARGHEAYSCDIQEPSGGHPEWHILGDALKAIEGGQIVTMDGVAHDVGKWDLLIAHPPCTYLSNAGARHLWKGHQLQANRVMFGIQGRDLFMRFWWADVPRICVENPVPSKVFCLPPYTQAVQPYEYGHPYSKKTCLWLKALPPLFPTILWSLWLHGVRLVLTHISIMSATRVCLPPTAPKIEQKHFQALQKRWLNNGG